VLLSSWQPFWIVDIICGREGAFMVADKEKVFILIVEGVLGRFTL
jgi:hypothetical protein